jgi:SAM-dependent methyltransferase
MKQSSNFQTRSVEPELLDELPSCDPRAQRSRRDLRRVNAWMGNARLVANHLRDEQPRDVIELGAGDGTFLLAVAKRLGKRWAGTRATLVDRQDLLSDETKEQFSLRGWSVKAAKADVFDWLGAQPMDSVNIVIANLFLHHFSEQELRRLLALVAERADLLVACEPKRSPLALAGTRLLPLIGCNGVTRHDALVSVGAGFNGNALSELWPEKQNWRLVEKSSGMFSHVFVARRQ